MASSTPDNISTDQSVGEIQWLTVETVRIDASKMRHVSDMWMGNLEHDPLYCALDRPFTVCYCWCSDCRNEQGLCICPGCETWHPYDRDEL